MRNGTAFQHNSECRDLQSATITKRSRFDKCYNCGFFKLPAKAENAVYFCPIDPNPE